jgi:hypothetical protein
VYIPKNKEHNDSIPCLYYRGGQTRKTILFFHGQAVDIGTTKNRKKMKTLGDEFEANVLSVEYPGYG